MEIRLALADDADAIERIRIRGWQTAYRHVFPPEKLDALAVDAGRWRASLGDPGSPFTCLVGEEAGRVVGWITVGPAREARRARGEVLGLYVDPGHWGRGAGRALLERGERELARSWDDAVLWTLADNPRTRRFYEANGWRPDGGTGVLERLGVAARVVRYRKRLRTRASSSTSRS